MSDNIRTPTAKEIVAKRLAWSSDSDDSNSAGSHGYFDGKPRSPFGRFARAKRQRELEEQSKNEKEDTAGNSPLESTGKTSKYFDPPAVEKPDVPFLAPPAENSSSKHSLCSDEDQEKKNEADAIPPLQPAPDYRDFFPSDLDSSSDENVGEGGENPEKVRFNIGMEGTFCFDMPAHGGNGLAAAIGKILQAEVDNSCGCSIDKTKVFDPLNLTKNFSSHDKALKVQCSMPGGCNRIDITGANYCSEREKSPQEIVHQRNRSLRLGTEEHYYMGKAILEYEDFIVYGGETMLYAKMGENGEEKRLVKKDSVTIYFIR